MNAWGYSDTAATAGNPLFPPSGRQMYRCGLEKAAVPFVDVEAATGDDAAVEALKLHSMAKVVTVNPAPQRAKLTAKAA